MTGRLRGAEFRTFQDAYAHVLADLHDAADYAPASRGLPAREHIGVTFQVTDPVQRHVWVPARRSNLIFNLAEVLWYLSGTADVDPIAYYAPGIRKYSADGRTLTGSAYGSRLFAPDGKSRLGSTQWDRVIDMISADPDTRRAVLQILDAGEINMANVDVACTLGLQFVVRHDRLTCIAFMRSSDAFRGMVSDVFSFTFIQELLARQLGFQVGSYVHCAGSLHLYESDATRVPPVTAQARAPRCGSAPRGDDPPRFPPMPQGDNWPHIREVHRFEELLRENRMALSLAQLEMLSLPRYWQQVVGVFECYRQLVHDNRIDPAALDFLDRVYANAIKNRWPDACRVQNRA
jgi:thymidylate synthase